MEYPAFNPRAALAFLDDAAVRLEPVRLPSVEDAWEAAWITCMTLNPRHMAAAQTAFASAVEDMDRLSVARMPAQGDAPPALTTS